MNIENRWQINNEPIQAKSKMSDLQQKDIKNAVVELYKKIRREVPQSGSFQPLIETFEKDKRKYALFIQPSPNKKTPNDKELILAYISEENGDITITLKRGTKQDILEYAGNEKNINEIMSFADFLYERNLIS